MTNQIKRTWIIIGVLFSIAAIGSVSFLYAITHVIEPTITVKNTLSCCPDLITRCLIILVMIHSVLPWIGIAVLLIGLINAVSRLMLSINGSMKLSERLEWQKAGVRGYSKIKKLTPDKDIFKRIIIFEDNRLHNAFTVGFLQPKIYLSGTLCKRLKREELKAVILHESHHVRKYDPLRLLMVAFICDTFFFIPLSRFLKELFISSKEKAADDAAIAASRRPLELASAMMKLLKLKNDLILNPTAIWRADSQTERIHRLIDPMKDRPLGLPYLRAAVSLIVIVVLLGMLTLPSFAYKLPILGTLNCRSSHSLIVDK